MNCSGECGDDGKDGQKGVALVVLRSITLTEHVSVEFSSGQLQKVTYKI